MPKMTFPLVVYERQAATSSRLMKKPIMTSASKMMKITDGCYRTNTIWNKLSMKSEIGCKIL